jgi:hypothetical protein
MGTPRHGYWISSPLSLGCPSDSAYDAQFARTRAAFEKLLDSVCSHSEAISADRGPNISSSLMSSPVHSALGAKHSNLTRKLTSAQRTSTVSDIVLEHRSISTIARKLDVRASIMSGTTQLAIVPHSKSSGTHSPARDLDIADAIRSTSRVSSDDAVGGGNVLPGRRAFQFIESLNGDLQCKLKRSHLRPAIIVIHGASIPGSQGIGRRFANFYIQRPTSSSEERNSTRCRLSAICTCSRSRQSSLYCSSSLTTGMDLLPRKGLRADFRRAAECFCCSELDWLGFIRATISGRHDAATKAAR